MNTSLAKRRDVTAIDVAGRVPPHNLDAEAAVLSAILLDGRLLDVVGFLEPKQFYSEAHARIFEGARELQRKSQPIDIQTVAAWLRDRDWLQAIGGVSMLAKIVDATPAVAHLEAHGRIVEGKAQQRAIIDASQMVTAEGYCHAGDVAEYRSNAERLMSAALEHRGGAELVSIEEVGRARRQSLAVQWADPTKARGLLTGIPDFDRQTDGLFPGQLHTLAALTSGGKSAFGLQVAWYVAGQEFRGEIAASVVISGEMDCDEMYDRALAQVACVNCYQVQHGTSDPSVIASLDEAHAKLRAKPLFFFPAKVTVSEMRSLIVRAQRDLDSRRYADGLRRRVRFVLLDYLQIMRINPERGERFDLAIGRYTSESKELSGELGVHLMELSQFNRSGANSEGRPRISQLKEAGSIENDSDLVSIIHRPHQHDDDKDSERGLTLEDRAIVYVDKNRGKGLGVGRFPVRFHKAQVRFEQAWPGDIERWAKALDKGTPTPARAPTGRRAGPPRPDPRFANDLD